MIVWLNGTFGVGKTTVARTLVGMDSRYRLFDPEDVGYMLRNNLAGVQFADFQELPAWRRLVPPVASEVLRATEQSLVAVQTVLDKSVWDELADGFAALNIDVMMVHLAADEATLRDRIRTDVDEPNAVDWRLEHLRHYESARVWLTDEADLTIDTSELSANAIADVLVGALASHQSRNPTMG